ncbi:hypothetical protein [Insolitispirillum peregrinum]|uniref:hypothetical protein n=1 Tax=Insolitispirillum peregrinum TaxID=80876 RepID=UPI00360D443A
MTIEVDIWQLVGALLSTFVAFVTFVAAAGKVLLGQIDRRLELRFSAVEAAAKDLQALERDFLSWKADLPLQYVRRDDYVRNQTIIEAKLDALAVRIDNMHLREGGK